jgi:hypothetical protein
MKTHGEAEVYFHIFINSTLNGGEWSSSCSGLFNSGGKPPLYAVDKKASGLQSQSARRREENNPADTRN